MMEKLATGDYYMTVRATARRLRISRYAVYKWIERGWLEAVKLPNGDYRILKSSVDKALENKYLVK